jgi:hypothetical protein
LPSSASRVSLPVAVLPRPLPPSLQALFASCSTAQAKALSLAERAAVRRTGLRAATEAAAADAAVSGVNAAASGVSACVSTGVNVGTPDEAARAKAASSSEGLIYGEVEFPSLASVLWALRPWLPSGGKFVDLGSGSGRGVLAAAFLHDFSALTGVELLHGLHLEAVRITELFIAAANVDADAVAGTDAAATTLEAAATAAADAETAQAVAVVAAAGRGVLSGASRRRFHLCEHTVGAASAGRDGSVSGATVPLEVVYGSFFDFDWSDADVVFAHSTCFDDAMMEKLGRMCLGLKPGAVVITFTTELAPGPGLRTVSANEHRMSWGRATVYVHQRVAD